MLDDISGFIKRHPVLIYFALVFIITWGGILFVVGPEGFPGEGTQFQRLFPLVFLAMAAGPSLAGILLTGITEGREGLRGLLSRMSRWRVNIRWYGVVSQGILGPSAASARDNLLWYTVFAVSLWVVVVVFFTMGGAKMSVQKHIEME